MCTVSNPKIQLCNMVIQLPIYNIYLYYFISNTFILTALYVAKIITTLARRNRNYYNNYYYCYYYYMLGYHGDIH